MNLFYTPDITPDFYLLNETESKHCVKVLRLRNEDKIFLIDGRGGFYKAEIIDDNPKKCLVKIIETKKEYNKRDFYVHIAIAPTKNIDRFEWFLEKATEIGIDEITPIICQHSERKVIKPERLNKVITSAIKQSLKAYHPILNNIIKFDDFIKKDFQGNKFIAHCYNNNLMSLKNAATGKKDVIILIGPEGDFSIDEVKKAVDNDYTEISLGKSRLRTETAGVVACHTINLLNDEGVIKLKVEV